jgi:hypothetical protein
MGNRIGLKELLDLQKENPGRKYIPALAQILSSSRLATPSDFFVRRPAGASGLSSNSFYLALLIQYFLSIFFVISISNFVNRPEA